MLVGLPFGKRVQRYIIFSNKTIFHRYFFSFSSTFVFCPSKRGEAVWQSVAKNPLWAACPRFVPIVTEYRANCHRLSWQLSQTIVAIVTEHRLTMMRWQTCCPCHTAPKAGLSLNHAREPPLPLSKWKRPVRVVILSLAGCGNKRHLALCILPLVALCLIKSLVVSEIDSIFAC